MIDPPREARDFTEFLHARFTRRAPETLAFDKLDAKRIAAECGLKSAEVLAVHDRPETIDFSRPTPFVIKPTRYAAKKGVRLIVERNAKGQYLDAMHDVWLRSDTIVRKLRALIDEKPRAGNRFIVERFIPGRGGDIPRDYKVYVIGGRAAFVLEIDRNRRPAALAFFDPVLAPLTQAELSIAADGAQPGDANPPLNGKALIEAAERVAAHIRVNFIRVDLFTDGVDIWLGELTPVPGGAYYGRKYRLSPAFDRALGDRWRAANLALGLPIPTIRSEPPTRR